MLVCINNEQLIYSTKEDVYERRPKGARKNG